MGCDVFRLSLPGPGAYKAEAGMDIISSHPVAPAFSLAAPWQPLRPTSARPGPGAYRHAHPYSFMHVVTLPLTLQASGRSCLLHAQACCCGIV